MIVSLAELPEVNPERFRYDNSVYWLRLASPICGPTILGGAKRLRDVTFSCVQGVTLLGWNRLEGSPLMHNRDRMVAVLFHYETDYGAVFDEIWEHVPIDDSPDEGPKSVRFYVPELSKENR